MGSINKLSSLGYALGISLGVALSGVVYATGPITNTFTAGDTLTADNMNIINNAVKDLQGNVPSTSCRNNAGAVDAGAIRVGPTCVDNARTANGSVSWAAAVNACRTAGKRLLTPGEYVAALNSGLFADMVAATPNQYEWVDAVASRDPASAPFTGASRGRLTVGYMGPDDGTNLTAGEIFFGTNADYDDASLTFIGYRCAR